MRSKSRVFSMTVALACSVSASLFTGALHSTQAPAAFKGCDVAALTALKIDQTVIREAAVVPPGSAETSRMTPLGTSLPLFCRVRGSVAPARDSLINFEVWIPELWNGKIVVTGNGGYGNSPSYRDMAHALSQGYAAVGGDTGHQTPTPDDLLWGAGLPERILDWGTRSIHAITGPTRRIAEGVKGKPVRRAYFYRVLNRRPSGLCRDSAVPAGLRRRDRGSAGQQPGSVERGLPMAVSRQPPPR